MNPSTNSGVPNEPPPIVTIFNPFLLTFSVLSYNQNPRVYLASLDAIMFNDLKL